MKSHVNYCSIVLEQYASIAIQKYKTVSDGTCMKMIHSKVQIMFLIIKLFRGLNSSLKNILNLVETPIETVSVTEFDNFPNLQKLDSDYYDDDNLPLWFTNPQESIRRCITTQTCTNSETLTKKYNEITKSLLNPDNDQVYRTRFYQSLKLHKLQTNSQNTRVTHFYTESAKLEVRITAFDSYGNNKIYGGDIWIARVVLETPLTKSLKKKLGLKLMRNVILVEKSTDHKNGSYTLVFPNFQKMAEQFVTIKLEVFLEFSAETIEFTRQIMSYEVGLSRNFGANLKTNNGEEKLGLCSFFKVDNVKGWCDFSESSGRTWFCYHKDADCAASKNDSGIVIGNAKIADGLWKNPSLSEVFDEYGLGEYAKLVHSVDLLKSDNKSHFDLSGNKFSFIKQRQDIKSDKKRSTFYPGKSFYNPLSQIQLSNKTVVVIGDSLGRQTSEDLVSRATANLGDKLWDCKFDLTGQEAAPRKFLQMENQEFCLKRFHKTQISKMSPFQQKCYPGKESAEFFTTKPFQLYMIPHGKIIHHGGCDTVAQPWMVDTFARLEEYAVYGKDVIIYLTAGAHFSLTNPVIFYNRLTELKTVVYKFLDDHPGTLVIYRLGNYWTGEVSELSGVVSSYNGRVVNQIIKDVFLDDGKVKIIELFDFTESVFDPKHPGIHPHNAQREMIAVHLRKMTNYFYQNISIN